MFLALLLACAASAPVLPTSELPAGVLLQREWIPLGQGDRSLGRIERIDAQGCWTVASNLWLWAHDPVLLQSSARTLYFNGSASAEPWFCLDASQRWRLHAALETLPPGDRVDLAADAVLALRWTARVDGRLRTFTHAYGHRHPDTAAVEDLLGSLAAEGVWAQSPE